MSHKTTVRFEDGLSFDAELQGHHFKLDSDAKFGGRNRGPTPKPLILTALAGCTGMDVASILAKMRMPFDSFEVQVEGDLTDEHPVVYTRIHVRYVFSGAQLDREKIEKAVDLSRHKYCGVFAMLDNVCALTHEIVTSGA
jgi:putative redox protein